MIEVTQSDDALVERIAKMLDEMADKAATYERQMCLIEAAAKVRANI